MKLVPDTPPRLPQHSDSHGMVSYRGFIQQGLDPDEALEHTREFMKVVLSSANNN